MGWRVGSNGDRSAEQAGAIIRAEREKRDLTGARLAQLAGVSPSTVSQLELGKRAVSLDLADQVLAVLGLRLHLAAEPLWKDIDKAIAEGAGRPPTEVIRNWKTCLTAYCTFLDGLPYIIDGPAAAALQGVPVAVNVVSIAVPADDEEALSRIGDALYRMRAQRGEGWESPNPRIPGSPRYHTLWWGSIDVRLVSPFKQDLWIKIDPLPEPTAFAGRAPMELTDIERRPVEPLKRAMVAVTPIASMEAEDATMRRLLDRTRSRLAEG